MEGEQCANMAEEDNAADTMTDKEEESASEEQFEEPTPEEPTPEEPTPGEPGNEEPTDIPDEDVPTTDIPDEEVPLTGDNSQLFTVVTLLSAIALAVLVFRKKEEA